jgi:hypothetical protein
MEPMQWLCGTRPAEMYRAVSSTPPGAWLLFSLSPRHDPVREGAGPGATLVVLDPRLTVLGPDHMRASLDEALSRPDLLTLLVPPGTPPPVTGVNHGPVRSFVGPAELLQALPVGPAELRLETLCYWALWSVMHGARAGVVARECAPKRDGLPPWTPGAAPGRHPSTALVMAHRGPADLLRAALLGLALADPPPDVVRVGLDVDRDELDAYRRLAQEFPAVEFYAGSHAPVGPYVIRQALGSLAAEQFLVFHDSDDHSTSDRFHWLHAEIADGKAGLVGSHELRYDEDDREVRAVRFPLDVTAALAVEPKHPQLHPTTLMPAADFRRIGGFSTDCVFGNDTQMILRAYFQLPLRNVDRFLYIRRDRWESLTNAPETGMKNPLRIARNLAWWSDFKAIIAGGLRLEDSSLMAIDGCRGWELRRLDSFAERGLRGPFTPQPFSGGAAK